MPEFTSSDRDAIKATIRRRGVLQDELAEALGVSKSTISSWLSGDITTAPLDKAIPAYVAGLERGVQITAAKAA